MEMTDMAKEAVKTAQSVLYPRSPDGDFPPCKSHRAKNAIATLAAALIMRSDENEERAFGSENLGGPA